jgi:peptidoglycan/LPS O-acetylase OafA/YrhL
MIVQEKIRIDFLDVVRGIAAVSVLIAHSSEIFFPQSAEFWNNYLNLGQVGVVSFFLVSGFVIPFSLEKSNSLYAFLISRVFRIYPLYLFVMLVGFLLLVLKIRPGNEIFHQNMWVNISSHFFFLQEYLPEHKFGIINLVNGSWTLFLEAFWYFLFAFLFILKSNKKTDSLFWIVNFFFLFLSVVSFFSNTRLPLGRIERFLIV